MPYITAPASLSFSATAVAFGAPCSCLVLIRVVLSMYSWSKLLHLASVSSDCTPVIESTVLLTVRLEASLKRNHEGVSFISMTSHSLGAASHST